jgi:YVTN family beta-propeller protein
VHRAARIGEAAHGGQVLVSDATRALVEDDLPEGISLLDLGWYRLKDVDRPERVSQVVAVGLESRFPPLRGAGSVDAPVLRRRSLLAAMVAGVIAAAVAIPVFALGEGHSSASKVKIAPNSLAAIDPETNKVVADIPVGRRPVAVAVGGGAVWVTNGIDQTVDRIDPSTGKVVASIGVGKDVSDIAIGFGSVWVADGSDETLTRIDPTQNAVESTLTFGAPNQLAPAPIYNVTIGDDAVWATRGNTILRIDPRTDQIARTIRIGTPTGVAVANGGVWVTTSTDHLLRIDSGTGVKTLNRSLTDVPSLPILGGGALWTVVTLGFTRAQVTRVDPDTGSQTGSVTMGPGSFISGLAWGGDAIWASDQGGTVMRIDPSAVQTRARIHLGHATTGVAVGEGRVWVAVAASS